MENRSIGLLEQCSSEEMGNCQCVTGLFIGRIVIEPQFDLSVGARAEAEDISVVKTAEQRIVPRLSQNVALPLHVATRSNSAPADGVRNANCRL